MIREQLLNPDAADLAAFLNRHTRACECLVQVAGQAEVIRIPANPLYFWNHTKNITPFWSPYFLPFPVNRNG